MPSPLNSLANRRPRKRGARCSRSIRLCLTKCLLCCLPVWASLCRSRDCGETPRWERAVHDLRAMWG
eukprot:5462997-Alexandrium_andersonii.AAC.1